MKYKGLPLSLLVCHLSKLTRGIEQTILCNCAHEIRKLSDHNLEVLKQTISHFSSFAKLTTMEHIKSVPSFKMGLETLEVPMTLFEENRRRLRLRIMDKVGINRGMVLLQGGNSLNHYNTDVEYVFRQEPNFHWMFGVTEPGFYGAMDVYSGESFLFIPKLPEEYAIWMGQLLMPIDVKNKYGVNNAYYIDQMAEVLYKLKPDSLMVLTGRNTDSDLEYVEPTFEGISKFKVDTTTLFSEITECRVIKTKQEIEVMRYVCKISSEAHKNVMAIAQGGIYEYQAESAFLHYCYSIGGCRHSAYTSICGTGCNCAILHYGHAAAPNSKRIKDGDLCLFDMGGSYCGYCADITCTFPVNGKFTDKQKAVYNAVLAARNAVLQAMQPDVSWVEMHLLANKVMLTELKEQGLLKGNVKDMMENDIGAVFQPHGLGHFLGCDVHDVGGYMDYTPKRSIQPGLKALRTARVLKAGMVITVEPGCYFIKELLDKAFQNDKQSKFLNKGIITQFMCVGGVRIEDDVVVTDTGIENLVDVPRTVEEIEKFMETENINVSRTIK